MRYINRRHCTRCTGISGKNRNNPHQVHIDHNRINVRLQQSVAFSGSLLHNTPTNTERSTTSSPRFILQFFTRYHNSEVKAEEPMSHKKYRMTGSSSSSSRACLWVLDGRHTTQKRVSGKIYLLLLAPSLMPLPNRREFFVLCYLVMSFLSAATTDWILTKYPPHTTEPIYPSDIATMSRAHTAKSAFIGMPQHLLLRLTGAVFIVLVQRRNRTRLA